MAISVKHAFVTAKPDDPTSDVSADEWNDEHTVTGVQDQSDRLDDIAALAATNSNFIVGDGTNWVVETGATVRTSLGLGTGDSPTFTNVNATGTYQKSGTTILNSNTTDLNVMVGEFAGDALTTGGQRNVAVGNLALSAETTGGNQVAIGYNALPVADGGSQNIALGSNAMRDLSTGSENVGIGGDTLQQCTTGTRNLAVGKSALRVLTSGSNNVGMGRVCGDSITTGSNNMLIGGGAGGAFTTMNDNVAIGSSALGDPTSATANVAIGTAALRFMATANSNVAIGNSAGAGVATNTTSQNIFIGNDSGRLVTSASQNVTIGHQSGEDLTSGDNNILIGASTGSTQITTGSNNILFGYDLVLPSVTASNQMSIGNLLFSEGIDGTGTTISSGHLGVGVVSPLAKLHVDQSSTTAAIPVLYLDQADISEEMIEFNTTIGVGNAIEAIGAKTLTTTHFIKVTIPGGLTVYFPVGTIA